MSIVQYKHTYTVMYADIVLQLVGIKAMTLKGARDHLLVMTS